MKKALSLIVLVMIFTLFLFSCQSYLVKDADTTLVLEDTVLDDEEVPPVVEMPSSEMQQEAAVQDVPPSTAATHYVSFTSKGFEPTKLTIKVGDTIIWKNERVKDSALLLGSQSCKFIKSEILAPGEQFSWTFDAAISCPFVDGIFVTAVMNVVVQ